MRSKGKIGCALLLGIPAVAVGCGFAYYCLTWMQLLHGGNVAVVKSPRMGSAQIWVARGWSKMESAIYAKTDGHSPVCIVQIQHLWSDSFFLQWTKDGQVAVFTAPTPWSDGVRHAGAYDFVTGKAVLEPPLPPGISKCQINGYVIDRELGTITKVDKDTNVYDIGKEGRKTKAAVADLIVLHGGLRDEPLSLGNILNLGKETWFWQIPQTKDSNPRFCPEENGG